VSRGGTRYRYNLAPACGGCNWLKNDMTPAEWWMDTWLRLRGLSWPEEDYPGYRYRPPRQQAAYSRRLTVTRSYARPDC
jgi:hypothetical protein